MFYLKWKLDVPTGKIIHLDGIWNTWNYFISVNCTFMLDDFLLKSQNVRGWCGFRVSRTVTLLPSNRPQYCSADVL